MNSLIILNLVSGMIIIGEVTHENETRIELNNAFQIITDDINGRLFLFPVIPISDLTNYKKLMPIKIDKDKVLFSLNPPNDYIDLYNKNVAQMSGIQLINNNKKIIKN